VAKHIANLDHQGSFSGTDQSILKNHGPNTNLTHSVFTFNDGNKHLFTNIVLIFNPNIDVLEHIDAKGLISNSLLICFADYNQYSILEKKPYVIKSLEEISQVIEEPVEEGETIVTKILSIKSPSDVENINEILELFEKM